MPNLRDEWTPILARLYMQGRQNANVPITSISVNPDIDELLAKVRKMVEAERERSLSWQEGVFTLNEGICLRQGYDRACNDFLEELK